MVLQLLVIECRRLHEKKTEKTQRRLHGSRGVLFHRLAAELDKGEVSTLDLGGVVRARALEMNRQSSSGSSLLPVTFM